MLPLYLIYSHFWKYIFQCLVKQLMPPVIFNILFYALIDFTKGFPIGSKVKASAWNVGDPGLIPGSGSSPGEGKWQPPLVLLPGEYHGGRSLVGYIPWGCKESDTTEQLHIHDPFLTSKIFLGKKMYSWVLGCFTIVSNSLGPMDCSPLGFSFHGILQARMLEWIAMPCSRGSSQPRDQTCISCSSCPAGRFFTAEPLKKPRKEDTFSLNGKVAGRVLYHEIFSQI